MPKVKYDIAPEHYIIPNDLDITNKSYIYGEVNPQNIIDIIKDVSEIQECKHFIDIGSGCGRLVIQMSAKFPNMLCTGIEIHNTRYETSLKILNETLETDHGRVEFEWDDYNNHYFGNYDVLYCCNVIFSKEDNDKLYEKIFREFSGYLLLYNYSFDLAPYIKKSFPVQCSWDNNVNIYLFHI